MIDLFIVGAPAHVRGRVAIALRPRGGDWLHDELASLLAQGFTTLVSALTHDEQRELELTQESAAAAHLGLIYHSLPTPDGAAPSTSAALPLVHALADAVAGGACVAVHCRQGIGRSGTLVAAILVALDARPDEAWVAVSAARGRNVPDRAEQRDWLARVETQLRRRRRRE